MFLADGGGGGAPPPAYSGTQTLNVEPSAIPGALAAFREAYDRVQAKVAALGGLEVPDWAGDPVSGETAVRFAERTNGGAADSAIACLRGYEHQLRSAIDALEAAYAAYTVTEGTNTAMWGKKHS
ncbi:transcriptional regulator [Actinokineospora soli]|uniref:Transcriptional regulator n=1 Tax=Actinokineospora soli TaxID=1048753 RepID=A0ABW2TZM9_9PSEU